MELFEQKDKIFKNVNSESFTGVLWDLVNSEMCRVTENVPESASRFGTWGTLRAVLLRTAEGRQTARQVSILDAIRLRPQEARSSHLKLGKNIKIKSRHAM